ncbi:MAG: ABC transporter permease [Planctomycetia bacterium]
MPPFRLVWKNLLRHRTRALLTAASLAVAIFLLCVLRSLLVVLESGIKASASNRLIVQSSVSLFVYLPESYEAKLERIEGVERVVRWNWFGGYYQEPKNFFAQFATDVEDLFEVYPEIELVEGSQEDFFGDRRACVIGSEVARKFNMRVGDTMPVIGGLFPRTDGQPWDFRIAGIYHSVKPNVDNNTLFFHADFLQKALESGAANGPEGVGIFVLRLEPGADRVRVAEAVDALFSGGPQRTQTTTEAEFQAQFVSMVGNVPFFVGSIGGGVLIAILLATLNTMLMAAREQTRDIGVLKALGFRDGTVFGLMLGQSMLLTGVGGIGGLLIALSSEQFFAQLLGTAFPGYHIAAETVVEAVIATLLIGVLAGIVPALRARKLSVLTALRSVG